jgi:D-glycero-alpha-D-manno-heptose 1-phosphate guanylyltransferase
MIKEAIILAGGFGTRLQSVVSEVPKPMAPVNGKPFLEYLLLHLKKFQVQKVILSVGYKAESIIDFFGNSFGNLAVEYSIEEEPLGTGGAVKLAMEKCNEADVLVLNGDSFVSVNLNNFYSFHISNNSDASFCLYKINNAARYGTVELDEENRITGFAEKKGETGAGIINGGIYLFKNKIFNGLGLPAKFSLEKDFFEPNIENLNMMGYISNGYFIDIGIPEDYQRAQDDFKKFEY